MSADVAAALYPLVETRTESLDKIWHSWKTLKIERVPAPVMLFLTQAFPNTDWSIVLRKGMEASVENRLEPHPSWLSMGKAHTHRLMGISRAVSTAFESATAGSSTSSTAVGSANVKADSFPKKLTCWYKFPWISHAGWMTGIYLTKGKPHFRYACAGCLQHLQHEKVQFELHPSSEEEHQIVEDVPAIVAQKVSCHYKFPWISHAGWMTKCYFWGLFFDKCFDIFWTTCGAHFGVQFGTRSAQEAGEKSPRGPSRATKSPKAACSKNLKKQLVFQ